MTHVAGGGAGGVPRIWLLPIALVAVMLGVTAAGVLSRSLLLDFIACWPVWLLLAIATFAARKRSIGKVRLAGLVPLVTTAALVVFVVAHLSGWTVMPSTGQTLVGPVADPSLQASLTARISGDIELTGGSDFLYQVEPIRRGGSIGIPGATEQTQGLAISVTLEEPSDPGLYAFSGWDITLTADSLWALTLEGVISADLTDLQITGLQLFGEGELTLSTTDYDAPVALVGEFELTISDSIPARVVGAAEVPDSWEQTTDGWRSPAAGDGWIISPSDDSLVTVVSA